MSKTKDLKNATLEVIDHIHDGWDAYDSCTKFELNRAELIEAFKLEFWKAPQDIADELDNGDFDN